MKLRLSLVIVLLLSAFIKSNALAADYPSVPGELVVKLKESRSHGDSLQLFQNVVNDLQKKVSLKATAKIRLFKTSDQFAVIQVSESEKSATNRFLNQDSRVAYAEPNYLYHILGEVTPDDDQFAKLWGMKNTGQADDGGQVGTPGADIHVAGVWGDGIVGSKSIKVAVIDTGIDYTHPDLKDNMWINTAEVAGNGADDDHNGFIDDVYGWNFTNNTADPRDDHNHGTHCAGTIGAVGNNHAGVAGVNWKVTLVPVKFLDSQGSGSLDNAVQAIQYATKLGVNIMSNSWGGGAYTQALYDAISAAKDKGILFVAAAGNNSGDNDVTASYPASYPIDNIISVAATDNRDHLADFSNFGKTTVQVAAPGVKILSTLKDGQYGVFSGTSMATPHVAGIAALLLSNNPAMTYAEIKNVLVLSSDKVKSLNRKVIAKGRVNAYNAIHGIFPPDLTPPDSAWKDVAFSAETPHPYANSQTYTFPFHVPNAKQVRVVFDSIDTEGTYDKVSIQDANGVEQDLVSGPYPTGYTSDYIDGSAGQIVFTSDASVNKDGFKVGKLQAIY